MSDRWLSNTYLVSAENGPEAVMIDAGGPVQGLLALIADRGLKLTHVLLTHHHHDHVWELDAVLAAHPGTPVLIHPLERELVPQASAELAPGVVIESGALRIEPLHTPGHTPGMTSLLVNQDDLFTGDVLFKGSIGGVGGLGAATYANQRSSIMDTLLALPRATRIHPGHTDATTVGAELDRNPFVRVWSGRDPEGSEPCTALGEPATLIVWAADYDGGHKAWVRFRDGSDSIVPGSQVARATTRPGAQAPSPDRRDQGKRRADASER